MNCQFLSYAEDSDYLEPVVVLPVATLRIVGSMDVWTVFCDTGDNLHRMSKYHNAETILIGYPMAPPFQLRSMIGRAQAFQIALLSEQNYSPVIEHIYGGAVVYEVAADVTAFLRENFNVEWSGPLAAKEQSLNPELTRARLITMSNCFESIEFYEEFEL